VASLIEPFAGTNAEAVATRLLDRFGSLHRALVSQQGIDEPGEDADVLNKMRAARALVLAAAREEIARRRVMADDPDLHDYLKGLLGPHVHELLHAVFLDSRHGYIADECIASGTSDRLTGSARNLVARAFDLGARALILAHNHPSGSALPSPDDVATTARLGNLAAELDLALIDHLIVTQHQVYSFRAGGLL
jgi:DNA repair protein RadC